MRWKNRLTNYNFWISLISAVLLILQAFNFEFDIQYVSEIATGALGLLVVIGIISDPTKTSVSVDDKKPAIVDTDASKDEPKPSEDEQVNDAEANEEHVEALSTTDIKSLIESIKTDLMNEHKSNRDGVLEDHNSNIVINILND